jgi:RNA polymerase sigma-70 factor (ECF subfamily)
MAVMQALDTERVWRELSTGLRSFVSRRVREPADVDDIVQRVFLHVHRALPGLRDADRLPAWLYQTARRAIADHYRAPLHRREVAAGDALDLFPEGEPADADGGNEPGLALQELARCLDPLLNELGAGDREALRLVEMDGLTQVEAARRLGLSSSGMKSRIQRARARLRAVVDACCRVELDRRGGLVGYEARCRDSEACGDCRGQSSFITPDRDP